MNRKRLIAYVIGSVAAVGVLGLPIYLSVVGSVGTYNSRCDRQWEEVVSAQEAQARASRISFQSVGQSPLRLSDFANATEYVDETLARLRRGDARHAEFVTVYERFDEAANALATCRGITLSPTPAEDQRERDLAVSLRVAAAEYDVVQERLRADVRRITALRTTDMAWSELKLGSISQFGMTSDLVRTVERLRAQAKLDPDVQMELRAEREHLERDLNSVQSAQLQLVAVTSDGMLAPHFYEAAVRAMDLDEAVLDGLLAFYAETQFIERGEGAGEFVSMLQDANGRLLEALVLWEAAKLRLELSESMAR